MTSEGESRSEPLLHTAAAPKVTDMFAAQPFYRRLQQRQQGFDQIMAHFARFPPKLIVETGTTRKEDNWEGDGQSTRIWDWYCTVRQSRRPAVYSIDIDAAACATAAGLTTFVSVHCADSVKWLSDFDDAGKVGLLYLDSFDWSPQDQLESAFHHFCEIAAIWSRLPKGCLVVVDDRHAEYAGKHIMVQAFMRKLGIKPLFEGYQIGWLKP